MDPNELLQALQFSVGKTQEEIRMAEQFLTQAKTVNGYMPNLLLVACNKDAVIHVRQSAIVNLHTAVKSFWKRESLEQAGEVKPLEDMATLKENILEAMIKCADTPKIYKEMIEIIKHIANFDFPDKWPEILPSIIEKLKSSNDFQEVYGGLLALMAIFKVFKSLFTETDRLQNIVDSTFGFLETFASTLLGDSGLQAATALHVVLKVVTLANMWITPRYFLNEKNLETWMGYFKAILEKELPQELVSSTEDLRTTEQREKNVYWRIKRISSKIVTHFVTKFRKLPKEQKALSQVFSSNYTVGFFKIFMEILAKKKTNYIDTKLQFYAMRYIKKSFKDSGVKTLLQDHLEFYMFDVLVPSMYITMRNKEDWDENPIEFIRDEEDLMMRPNNLKTIAYRTLKKITSPDFTIAKKQVGGLVLVKFMKHAGQALSTGKDPRTDQPVDIRMKEAILHIIGVLKRAILETDEISEQMEFLLEKFVIPEFSNEIGFIRFRACWLFGIFGDLDFKGETIVQTATEGLYKCILDNKLPVKVQAGLALDRVSGHKTAHNILKPGLNKIFEIYLNLISVIDNEGLVSALEGIITKFGDDIHPYALDLIRNLTTVYAKQATGEGGEEDEDADEDDMDEGALDIQEKQAAASMCLSAISKILSCNLSQQTILEATEILLPLLRFTILDERTDDIEAGLGLLNVLLYNLETIPEKLWLYFLEIIYMITGKPESAVHPNFASLSDDEKFLLRHQITGWGSDYISEMVPCLQNYIQKGKNVIFTERDQYYNLTYVELIFKWIDRIYEICYNGTYDLDMALASQLYITIVENYPKQIDELLPYILDKTLFNFNRSRSNMMRKVLVQIIALCLWYDPRSTLLYIESKGATEVIFKKWMQLLPKFKLDYECERAMIGLSSIFRINVNDLPPLVLSSLPELIKQLIELSSKIIVLREEEEDEDEDGDDFDDDDDSDEDETEDNFDEIMARVNKANSGKSPFVDADSFNPKDYLGLSDEVLDKNDMMNDVQDFKALEWLHSQAEYDSPFDGKCEIGYFQEGLESKEVMQRDQPDAYNQLVGCLSNDEKTTLQGNFEKAHQQALEFQELMKKTA